jgi:uncharacterized OsmC-like protein
MATATIHYNGELRTLCTHLQSGKEIVTDAPTDNMGRGEAFSPTDLLATSLVTCMLTTMGIVANRENIPFPDAAADMTKVMASNPRRVAKVVIDIRMPKVPYTPEQKKLLEDTAHNCPVAKSLSPELVQEVTFSY